MTDSSKALADIAAERRRQIDVEGWTADHDDEHDDGSLAFAAAAYAINAANPDAQIDLRVGRAGEFFNGGWMTLARLCWPKSWDHDRFWKPKTPRADLVRAAALIVAEIERLDRQAGA